MIAFDAGKGGYSVSNSISLRYLITNSIYKYDNNEWIIIVPGLF